MQALRRFIAVPLVAAACVLAAGTARAADYRLTAPTSALEPDGGAQAPLAGLGPVQLAGSTASSGSGLSLQAGERWFARVGVGRSLAERDGFSVGGGYRVSGNESVSMHLTRQLGQDRLGLAVRYDWSRTYLRLSYEQPQHTWGSPERGVRFSAGVKF